MDLRLLHIIWPDLHIFFTNFKHKISNFNKLKKNQTKYFQNNLIGQQIRNSELKIREITWWAGHNHCCCFMNVSMYSIIPWTCSLFTFNLARLSFSILNVKWLHKYEMDFGHRLVYSKLSSVSLSQLVTIICIDSKFKPFERWVNLRR